MGEFWGRDEILSASILDNIRVGRENITNAEIENLLEDLGLLDDIRMLPEGENTLVQPFSNLLSPAITKGILLARNVIDKPELVIIDSEQLPSDPIRYRQTSDYLLRKDHRWAVLFFGEAMPQENEFDKVFSFEDGQLSQMR